ncbi:MAG: hypothetical protein AAGF85_08215 [Bacteroidota bacterium]
MQKAKVYRGIHYIRVKELPEAEQTQIRNIDSTDLIIKILTDSELMTDCITYEDYSNWYQNIYTQVSLVEQEEPSNEAHKTTGLVQRLKHRLLPDT